MTGWVGVVLNAPDARALAYFYRDLFGWSLAADEPDWCTMSIPEARANLAFQTEALYERPTWPAVIGKQQMMMHLDIGVTDLEAAVQDAIALGAELHVHQPQDDVRVMLDPAWHPFCLYVDSGGRRDLHGAHRAWKPLLTNARPRAYVSMPALMGSSEQSQ